MQRELEALLFAADQPLTVDRLAGVLSGVDRAEIRQAIDALREEYDRDERAFTIVEFGGGYSISTRPTHANLVRKLFRGRRKQRLTKAALEVLAIVAYKQPVTRLEVEEIRGVSASGVLGTLLERDLIQIAGRAESLGHPLLYATTRAFLDYLGLTRIQDLPQLSELEDLLSEKEELKQIAARYGHEVDEEDFDRVLVADGEADEGDEVTADEEDSSSMAVSEAAAPESPAQRTPTESAASTRARRAADGDADQ